MVSLLIVYHKLTSLFVCSALPDLDTVYWYDTVLEIIYQKLISEGNLTKVKYPTPQQAGKDYPGPVWRKFVGQFGAKNIK